MLSSSHFKFPSWWRHHWGRLSFLETGYIIFTVRKQREVNARTQLAFSLLFSSGPQPMAW